MATTSAPAVQWRSSLDEGLRDAKQQGRLVLLDFYSENVRRLRTAGGRYYHYVAVTSAIAERVIPVKVKPIDPANHATVQRYQQVWTPTIMLLSPEGLALHEWNGYLPPDLYLPQLVFGLGKAALKQDRLDAGGGLLRRGRRQVSYQRRGRRRLLLGGSGALQGQPRGPKTYSAAGRSYKAAIPTASLGVKQSFDEGERRPHGRDTRRRRAGAGG